MEVSFWVLVVCYLAGLISGVILWEKIGVNDVFKGAVRIKQRGKGNIQKPSLSLQMDRKQRKNGQISDRKRKRLEKKAIRLQNKL